MATDLQNKGLTPLSVKAIKQSTNTRKNLPLIEKINFCRYVATMLKSGLSITEIISVIAEEATHPVTKKILDDINFGIQHGQALSTIMARYPNSFDNFFVTIVKAGEVSGTLAQSFSQIEKELRSEHSLKQKIGGALLYPAVVFSAMIGIGTIMMFFVLPQIGRVFLNLKLPLAAPTRMLFEVSLTINDNKTLILVGVVISLVIIVFTSRTKFGKTFFMKILTPIPVVKSLLKQIDIARFCRIFSTLLGSGVPITQALEISLNSLNYPSYTASAARVIQDVTKGKTLSAAIKSNKVFPPLLTQMIAAGEKSGTLDETLKDLGDFYEEEVEAGVKKATQVLEPVLMLIVGIGVGIMILSVITPIYSVVNNIQNAR
ncbi:type II secretion system F family protein [Pseudomonadota bacterium]